MESLKGVNLGGWLVLERWMTPSLFDGLQAKDEYSWCLEHGDAKHALLQRHRDTFITGDDIAWLAEHGVTALRLPIPHWLFGGFEPFVPCESYVSWLLDEAGRHHMKVLLDLHTAPGSQNGNDHSGQAGKIDWLHGDNVQQTLNVLSNVVEKYGKHPALLGIELLNEPDRGIDKSSLLTFYERGIDIIHTKNPDCVVVVSDAYRPGDWLGSPLGAHKNVWLDVHMYQVFSDADRKMDIHKHIKKVHGEWRDLISDLQQTTPVVIGEWSGALDNRTFKGMDDFERDKAVQAYTAAQIDVFGSSAGWFYWSYKTESPDNWNFRTAVGRGWVHL